MGLSFGFLHGEFLPGGAQYAVLDLIQQLTEQGHQCTLYSFKLPDTMRTRLQQVGQAD